MSEISALDNLAGVVAGLIRREVPDVRTKCGLQESCFFAVVPWHGLRHTELTRFNVAVKYPILGTKWYTSTRRCHVH